MAANGNSMSNIIIRHLKQTQISTGYSIFGEHYYESINICFHEHTVGIQSFRSKTWVRRIILMFNDKNNLMMLWKLSDMGKSVLGFVLQ